MIRYPGLTQEFRDIVIGFRGGTGRDFLHDIRLQCRLFGDFAGQPDAVNHSLHVVVGLQEIERNRRRRQRIGRGQPHRPSPIWTQMHGAERETRKRMRHDTVLRAFQRAPFQQIDLQIRPFQARIGAGEQAGVDAVARHGAGAEQRVADAGDYLPGPAVFQIVQRNCPRAAPAHVGIEMIVQVGPDRRHVGDDVDPHRLQMFRRPETGQLQQLRRSVGTAGHDHLGACVRDTASIGCLILDADRTLALEQNAGRLRTGADGQIFPEARRFQIGFRGAPTAAVGCGGLIVAGALLPRPVEVGVARDARLFGRGQHRLGEFELRRLVRHGQGPAGGVEFVGAPGLVLRFLEERQDAVPIPALAAPLAPFVVVGVVATDIDHTVDRRRAAQRPPARQIQLSTAQTSLRGAFEFPIYARVDIGAGETERDMDPRIGIGGTGFQQQHAVLAGFRQSSRDGGAGRTCPGDDIVVCVCRFGHTPLPRFLPAVVRDRSSGRKLSAFRWHHRKIENVIVNIEIRKILSTRCS